MKVTKDILEKLLAASPPELRGEGDGEVAKLVREDEQVKGLAQEFLGGATGLNDVLGGLVNSGKVDEVITVIRKEKRKSLPRVLKVAAVAALPLAAALAIWTLGERAQPTVLAVPEVISISQRLSLEHNRRPASQKSVVFRTENPKITVMWFYQ